MAHPNINERRFYLARLLEAGRSLDIRAKRQAAELFNCHVSAIHADSRYFKRNGWRRELENAPDEWWQEGKIAGANVATAYKGREPSTKSESRLRRAASARMAKTARDTVKNSRGQEVLRSVKVKELGFPQGQDLESYVEILIEKQEGLCAISGIQLQYDDDCRDTELLCSLDRIDSDGHYESGNLQVVCRFINRWKGDSKDDEFRRLIECLRRVNNGVGDLKGERSPNQDIEPDR